MFEVNGKYASAQIYVDVVEQEAISQITTLLCQSFTAGCKVAIMPDVHAGKGCTIGFTANLGNKVVPNLVGVDIGCGMLTIPLGQIEIDLQKFDQQIKRSIPSGAGNYYKKAMYSFEKVKNLRCYQQINTKNIDIMLGTLGGGNHFIELDKDDEDNVYLVIHTGSRNLGKQICDYYQKLAIKECQNTGSEITNLIAILKSEGRTSEIEDVVKNFKSTKDKVPQDLCYLEGDLREQYLYDMQIAQEYASLNRISIAEQILKNYFYPADVHISTGLKVKIKEKGFKLSVEAFETIHNYINFEDNIIRKGAIAAYTNQPLLIPINMRDGCIYGYGKSNPDMNFSAPHGAGRLMSRSKAKELIDFNEYQKSMEGIYSSTVTQGTIDEAPQAYKDIQTIIDNIQDTVEIIKIIKPIYNFKAEEKFDRSWK